MPGNDSLICRTHADPNGKRKRAAGVTRLTNRAFLVKTLTYQSTPEMSCAKSVLYADANPTHRWCCD